MEAVRFRLISRILLVLGVASAIAGLALYFTGFRPPGVALLIFGAVAIIISSCFSKFFLMMDFEHELRQRKMN